MEGSDQLLTIAEIGAAFAGFTAIVGVLASSYRGNLGSKVSFWIMFEFSLATIFFSLLPFALSNFGTKPHIVWATSSSILALFLVAHVLIAGRFVMAAVARGELSKYSPRVFIPTFTVVFTIQILNAMNVFFDRSFAAFSLGLLLFLLMASVNFVFLLVGVWSIESVEK